MVIRDPNAIPAFAGNEGANDLLMETTQSETD